MTDRDEIRNTGDGPLKTLNVYVPPAYTEDVHGGWGRVAGGEGLSSSENHRWTLDSTHS
jgi:hypothetical protein